MVQFQMELGRVHALCLAHQRLLVTICGSLNGVNDSIDGGELGLDTLETTVDDEGVSRGVMSDLVR